MRWKEKTSKRALTIRVENNHELRLECLCADDFDGGDHVLVEEYERTREMQQALAVEADRLGIRNSVTDSDDGDSRHSDAYLYFPLSRLPEVAAMLDGIGLSGDILDVPSRFPQEEARSIGMEHGWKIQTGYLG